jgi:hypothetical protein
MSICHLDIYVYMPVRHTGLAHRIGKQVRKRGEMMLFLNERNRTIRPKSPM